MTIPAVDGLRSRNIVGRDNAFHLGAHLLLDVDEPDANPCTCTCAIHERHNYHTLTMRGPTINGDTRPLTDLQIKVNGETAPEVDGGAVNGTLGIRPKSALGLNGTYDELYRLQNEGVEAHMDTDAQAGSSLRHNRSAPLHRARSDFGPRGRAERVNKIAEEDLLHMRHGWHDEYTSNEYLSLLNSVCIETLPRIWF